jgi:hydroxymethylpyrimidine pyrophosphatase-like HAD family hydrolase
MGNALPPVKAAADLVVPSHDEDGLVTVVQWLLEERPGGKDVG